MPWGSSRAGIRKEPSDGDVRRREEMEPVVRWWAKLPGETRLRIIRSQPERRGGEHGGGCGGAWLERGAGEARAVDGAAEGREGVPAGAKGGGVMGTESEGGPKAVDIDYMKFILFL